MFNDQIPIEDYFRYHPPETEERKAAHEAVNNAALEFARVVDSNVHDVELKRFAILAIQQAWMFAN